MLKLFGHPVSQPTRAVSWLLAIKNAKHDYIRLSPVEGDTVKPDFLEKFPLGYVPAILDEAPPQGGAPVALAEGSAILAYLAETRQWDDMYPRSDVVRRARINEFLSWHNGAMRKCTVDCFRPHMLKFMIANGFKVSSDPLLQPVTEKGGMTEQETKTFLKDFAMSIDEMQANARWSEGNAKDVFLLPGDAPTVADLLVYCEVDQLDMLNVIEPLKKDKPLFNRWVDAMKKVEKHDEVRKPLAKLAMGIKKSM